MPASRLGAPTSPMVAKQLEEMGKRLNEGVKNVEIGALSPEKFETIPEQHFDEIRRLGKLTDSHVSIHGPMLDLSGFPEQGRGVWTEEQRASTEQHVASILERAHQVSNGENTPVVFHAGNTFSQEYGVPYDEKKHPDGLQREEYEKDSRGRLIPDENGEPKVKLVPTEIRAMAVVNQDTGEVQRLDYDKKHRLGTGKEEIWDPYRRMNSLNQSQWDKEKLKLFEYEKTIEELKEKMEIKRQQNEALEKSGLKEEKEYQPMHHLNQMEIDRMQRHIREINRELGSDYENVYHKFVKFASPQMKEKYSEHLNDMKKRYNETQEEINKRHEVLGQLDQMAKGSSEGIKEQYKEQAEHVAKEINKLSQMQAKQAVIDIAELEAPKMWSPVKDFSIEKTAETASGAIAQIYKKLKKKGKEDQTPILAMENFFVNTPMSRAKDLRKAVELSREKLVQKLKDKCDLSTSEAEKVAEKTIGATWDVGHINNLRKSGYEGEELKQKIIEESKHISEVVKHLHITDNFGFHDSHLPPGMGNVPIKEVVEELEKTWAKQEEEGRLHQTPRGIVEAGGFVAELGQNPQIGVLEYFGSPLYKISEGPYWTGPKGVAGAYSPYQESFIEFPQQHFNMYGSSFTTLPKTVGGQVGGEASRFSGTPNQ